MENLEYEIDDNIDGIKIVDDGKIEPQSSRSSSSYDSADSENNLFKSVNNTDPEDDILLRSISVPTSRTAPFNAEIGLISSLKAKRNFHKKVDDESKELTKTKILETTSDLSAYRIERDLEAEEYRESIALVHSLDNHKVGSVAPSSTNFEKLKVSSEKRKARHDDAVAEFLKTRAIIGESLETKVLEAARTMKETLSHIDGEIALVFCDLDSDELLVQENHDYVLHMWKKINDHCANRKQSIVNFGEELDSIEQDRSRLVGNELQNLVTKLVGVGYVLLPEIERLAESEANEVNLVTIANRRTHADLLARLMKDDIAGLVVSRSHWEKREISWRLLKHNAALVQYTDVMDSSLYSNPPSRVHIFNQLRDQQLKRHDVIRLGILNDLSDLLPPKLTKSSVEAIKLRCDELNESEELSNGSFFEALQNQKIELENDANTFRESLRSELHEYGALAPEPNLLQHKINLEKLTTGSLDDFFRKSGSLKSELKHIETTLGLPILIYQNELKNLEGRLEILIAAFDIESVLDAQGKVGDKKSIQTTLENLRVASISKIGPLLPTLLKQLKVLRGISGIDELVISEMDDISKTLTKIVKTNVIPKLKSKKHRQRKGGGSGPHEITSKATSTSKSGKGFDMAVMRTITKRLGMLVSASDLTDEIKKELSDIQKALHIKSKANEIIDEVVLTSSVSVIATRVKASEELIKLVGLSLQERSAALHEVMEAVCSMYMQVSDLLSSHLTQNITIDSKSEDDLMNLMDTFEVEDREREKQVLDTVAILRHASSNDELESKFTEALSLLETVENGYRQYFNDAMSIASTHPTTVDVEMKAYQTNVCEVFCMEYGEVKANIEQSNSISNDGQTMVQSDNNIDTDADISNEVIANNNHAKDASSLPTANPTAEDTAGVVKDPDGDVSDDIIDNITNNKTSSYVGEDDDCKNDDHFSRVLKDESLWKSQSGECYTIHKSLMKLVISRFFNGANNDSILDEEANETVSGNKSNTSITDKADTDDSTMVDTAESIDEYTLNSDINTDTVPTIDDSIEDDINTEATSSPAAGELEGSDISISSPETNASTINSLRPIPVDEDGVACLQELEIPKLKLKSMLDVLRSEILNQFHHEEDTRHKMADDLLLERESELTSELEERLRKHWPRRGRTDVMSYQPREGELTTHKQRYERHVRGILQRNSAASIQFETILSEAGAEVDKYDTLSDALVNALEMQNNLAKLKGVYNRGKDAQVSFKLESIEWIKKLCTIATDEPKRLLATNPEFIRSCKLFSDGGDYNKVEVKQAEEALQEAAEVVNKDKSFRLSAIEELKVRQSTSLSLFVSYQSVYEQCSQDLSLRDGLGQKYGAPRRNAQEKLRMEFIRSSGEEESIHNNLKKLESLCNGEVIDHKDDVSIASSSSSTVSQKIKSILLKLRREIISRAFYLDFVSEGISFDLPYISLNDDTTMDTDNGISKVTEKETLPESIPFMTIARDAAQKCRDETQVLYASEGKEAALGADGVPEALRKYLTEQLSKATALRESSARTLREQVTQLHMLLLQAPSVILMDIMKRCIATTHKSIQVEEIRINKKYRIWEEAKSKHKYDLKPQLSNPNEAETLNQLVVKENERSQECTQAIDKTMKRLILILSMSAEKFGNYIVQNTVTLMQLIESIPTVKQLGILPGDENVVHKRKGLKRLIREAKKREVIGGAGDSNYDDNTNNDHTVGDSVRMKDWIGLDMSLIDMPMDIQHHLDLLNEDKVSKEELNREHTGASSDGTKHLSEPIRSSVNPATRAIIKTRNSCYKSYTDQYQNQLRETSHKYTNLIKLEERWRYNWGQMVEYLKKQQI